MKKILKQFVDIWKLDFLTKFLSQGKSDNKTTIWFWVISSFVLTLLLLILFTFFVFGSQSKIIDATEKNVPDNAHVTITDGQLTTENIDEPFFREIDVNNAGVNYGKRVAIIINTSKQVYDITSLDDYEGGILVLKDRMYVKSNTRISQFIFTDIPNISFSKKDVIEFEDKYFLFPFSVIAGIFIGVVMFFYFVILRLVSAFWWALMLFIIMRIFDVKEDYAVAYKAVLNFYFIPSVVVIILWMTGFVIPLLTTMIFLAVFIANLIWYRKQNKKDSVAISSLDNIGQKVEKEEETPVITEIKK